MNKIIITFLLLLFSLTAVSADFGEQNTEIKKMTQFNKVANTNTLKVFETLTVNPFEDYNIVKLETQTRTCRRNVFRRRCSTSNTYDYYLVPIELNIPTKGAARSQFVKDKGVIFNQNHELFYKYNPSNPKIVEKGVEGVQATNYSYDYTTELLESTYTIDNNNKPIPKQLVKAKKSYLVNFSYDITPPTCGDVRYYSDLKGKNTVDYNEGDWINEDVYYSITCLDNETGCQPICEDDKDCNIPKIKTSIKAKEVINWKGESQMKFFCSGTITNINGTNATCIQDIVATPLETISHLSIPEATFTNNVNLTNLCTPKEGDYKLFKYDKKNPEIGASIDGNPLNINSNENSTILENDNKTLILRDVYTKKATDTTTLSLDLKDMYDGSSKYGVSGIKSYNIELLKLSERNFDKLAKEESLFVLEDEFQEFNPDGIKKISDIKETIILDSNEVSDSLKITGRYKFKIIVEDFAGNIVDLTIPLHIYPADISKEGSSITLVTDDGNILRGEAYANREDDYNYEIILKDKYGNPVGSYNNKNKYISSISQNTNNTTGTETIYLDMVNKTGEKAFVIDIIDKLDKNGKTNFTLRSYTPGFFTEMFEVKVYDWDDNYNNTGDLINSYISTNSLEPNSFKNILTATFNGVSTTNRSGLGNEIVEIGKSKNYGIGITRLDNGESRISGQLFKANIFPNIGSTAHIWEDGVIDNQVKRSNDKGFRNLQLNNGDKQVSVNAKVNVDFSSNVEGAALIYPKILLNKLTVGYRIAGKYTKYTFNANGMLGCELDTDCDEDDEEKEENDITNKPDPTTNNPDISIVCKGSLCIPVIPNENDGDNDGDVDSIDDGSTDDVMSDYDPEVEIDTCKNETLGVSIIGSVQGSGNLNATTSAGNNYTDLSLSNLRSTIKKNAYILKRGLPEGKEINKIFYVKGNTKYSDIKNKLSAGATLIVEDGNLFIDQNIEEAKKIGIIVLNDNYNVSKDPRSSKGNIYVKNTVTDIYAFIYADGAFISGNESGNKYSSDQLSLNRLKLYGSLFTRNTIGGSLDIGGSRYKLPGGKESTNFEIAYAYDLNYIRTVKDECDSSPDNYSFRITYDSSIKTNPPKGFAN